MQDYAPQSVELPVAAREEIRDQSTQMEPLLRSKSFSPMPGTFLRSSMREKRPLFSLKSTIAADFLGPMPLRASSSAAEALLMLIFADGAAPPACRDPPAGAALRGGAGTSPPDETAILPSDRTPMDVPLLSITIAPWGPYGEPTAFKSAEDPVKRKAGASADGGGRAAAPPA